MGRFLGWAKWSIIVVGVLLSPVLAFLLALTVAILVVVIKEAGLVANLAAVGAGAIAYWGVRRFRSPLRGQLDDT